MRALLALLAGLSIPAAAIAGGAVKDPVTEDLAHQASLAYAGILAGGVKAGRLYTREAAASGAKRHVEEFIARQHVPGTTVVSAE